MADSVIIIVASRTERAHLLVDAVEVVTQVPMVVCAEASQVDLVPSILQLGFFLLAEILIDLSNAAVFRSTGGILHIAVDHWDNASDGSWAAGTRDSASIVGCFVCVLVSLNAAVTRYPLDGDSFANTAGQLLSDVVD